MRRYGPAFVTLVAAVTVTVSESRGVRAAVHEGAEPGAPITSWRDLASPSPLTPYEESRPAAAMLARRYNPAMAISHGDIWPVPVRYAWADGSNLMARVLDEQGRVRREYEALPHQRLAKNDWGDLPTADADGNAIQYFVDAPGDDRTQDGISSWRRRWRAIMNGDAAANKAGSGEAYPPTQHAHLSWYNRDKGLLAIEYWFYYPYNEWINHHEGDWEHITVILRGPSRLVDDAAFRPVGYLFFFHEFVYEPSQVVRIGGSDPREDHVLVYVGGKSRFLRWSGIQSGASYPLPAVYEAVGGGITGLRANEDVSAPERFIRPEEFDVVMLPEPERLDVGLHPELSWLRLDFFAGQAVVHQNPLALNGMSFGSVPRQPARQAQWNHKWSPLPWNGGTTVAQKPPVLPQGWHPYAAAPEDDDRPLSARKGPSKRSKVRKADPR